MTLEFAIIGSLVRPPTTQQQKKPGGHQATGRVGESWVSFEVRGVCCAGTGCCPAQAFGRPSSSEAASTIQIIALYQERDIKHDQGRYDTHGHIP